MSEVSTTTTTTGGSHARAAGLAAIRCAPWCSEGQGHTAGHPDNQCCYGMFSEVELSREEPEQLDNGEYRKIIAISLEQEPFTEPSIVVCIQGGHRGFVRLTFDEWEKFAAAGNAAVEVARGTR